MVERNIKTGNFEDLITLSMFKKNITCVDIIEFQYIFFILFFYKKKKKAIRYLIKFRKIIFK